jgi:hypothetical protein
VSSGVFRVLLLPKGATCDIGFSSEHVKDRGVNAIVALRSKANFSGNPKKILPMKFFSEDPSKSKALHIQDAA